MAEWGFRRAFEFGDDALGEHLAQFHSPLVEGVDLPDGALREDSVLVKGDQLAQNLWREPIGQDRVRRPVAFKYAVGRQPVRRALGLHLLGRFPERQRLGLGKDVRHQHVVMAAQGIERLHKCDEVARDEPGPLVN